MPRKIKLDRAGVAQILKSPDMGRAVHELAEDLAADIRQKPTIVRHNAHVVVRDYVTDRRASAVTIAHPGGLAMQAKHGVLTKALPIATREHRSRIRSIRRAAKKTTARK